MIDLRLLGRRLPIRDLRAPDGARDPVVLLNPVDQNLQVQFPHSRNDGLFGFPVHRHHESRILLGQLRQRMGQLVLVGTRPGLDADRNHRRGKLDRLQLHGMVRIAERVARERMPESDQCADVAGPERLPSFRAVRMHLENAPDPLASIPVRVQHVRPRPEGAGVDPDIDKFVVAVAHHLEGQRRHRPFPRWGGGKEFDHAVEEATDSDVLQRGTAEHRNDRPGQRRGP